MQHSGWNIYLKNDLPLSQYKGPLNVDYLKL